MKHIEFFYAPPENISGTFVEISGDELKHLSLVLRKKERDIVYVVDGIGNLYTVFLTDITRLRAKGEIQKRTRFVGEPNVKLTLALAIPKGNRFDWAIEKGTEIGVSAFIPLICEHSILENNSTRLSRWKKIAIAAMKQCGRSILPEILPAQPIKRIIESKNILSAGFIAHLDKNSKSLNHILQDDSSSNQMMKSAIIVIGPEGGFSAGEVELAIDNQFKPFSLGPRRLRSETAGIIASAILLSIMEA